MTKVSKSLFVVMLAAVFVLGVVAMVSAAEYVNKEVGFSVTWPDGWTNQPVANKATDMKTLQGPNKDKGVTISVVDKGDIKSLKDCAAAYGKGLEASGIGSDFEVVSNEPTKTKDGSPAYFAETEWMYGGTTLITTGIMSAFKGNKWIYVHLWTLGALEDEEMEILNSLTLLK